MTEVDSNVTSPFQAIGGQAAVDRIVDLFYDRMDTLPEAQTIRAMHPADLSGIRSLFKKFLAEWLGGPEAYSQERGHPRLRRRHLPFPIGAAERDAWMLCMNGALEEVIEDRALRETLSRQLFGVADWMRNIEG
ncbi:MAG: group II truncated hemoglobin [Gammaproteobacteria bacterium]|jgi:hemoglobin|nr:group II truncated hemoglobin [Gammaproteobacteria bacterium]